MDDALPIDPVETAAALVASTFPAVFTRTKLWEPLSLAAPSAQSMSATWKRHPTKNRPPSANTLRRTDDAASGACVRQGGPLEAYGRVSISREFAAAIVSLLLTGENEILVCRTRSNRDSDSVRILEEEV